MKEKETKAGKDHPLDRQRLREDKISLGLTLTGAMVVINDRGQWRTLTCTHPAKCLELGIDDDDYN